MKKVLKLVIIGAACISALAACGNKKDVSNDSPKTTETTGNQEVTQTKDVSDTTDTLKTVTVEDLSDKFSEEQIAEIEKYLDDKLYELNDLVLSEDFLFSEDENKIVLYLGSDKVLVIPDKLDGIEIKTIGDGAVSEDRPTSAQSNKGAVTDKPFEFDKITISSGIKNIENNAFMGAKTKEIILPNELAFVGNAAFYRTHAKINTKDVKIEKVLEGAFDYTDSADEFSSDEYTQAEDDEESDSESIIVTNTDEIDVDIEVDNIDSSDITDTDEAATTKEITE